ncbi:hypothetical protein UlMin_046075 [Ulmus minor]
MFNFHFPLGRVFHVLFFIIGLSLGFALCFYLKSISIILKTSTISTSSLKAPPLLLQPLSPPPPLPPPPPPAASLANNGPVEWPEVNKKNLLHNMEDDELFSRAMMAPRREVSNGKEALPKVAFMFLTKGAINLGPLWEMFFRGHEGLYSIYVHPHPSFVDSTPESSVFYRRRIPSKAVEWGQATMIDAEKRLLASALLDTSNQNFILLSETCIPLFNFTTTYNYLINTNKSFIGSYDDPRRVGRGRYNRKMSPSISLSQWRKGSQWFEANRRIALQIISDRKYFPLFKEHCHPPCYMDEHYIPTLINIVSPEENSNRSVTWVDWSKSGPHPGKFRRNAVSFEFLNQIRFGTNCSYNGEEHMTSMCFLFARKFLPDTLRPLLQIAPLLFNSSVQI